MPFGKYRGLEVADLPIDYLEWLLDNVNLRSRLRAAVSDEICRRHGEQEARSGYERKNEPQAPDPAIVAIRIRPELIRLAREVFDLGYRAAARSLHPDVGGDSGAMTQLNLLAESVRTQFEAVGVTR